MLVTNDKTLPDRRIQQWVMPLTPLLCLLHFSHRMWTLRHQGMFSRVWKSLLSWLVFLLSDLTFQCPERLWKYNCFMCLVLLPSPIRSSWGRYLWILSCKLCLSSWGQCGRRWESCELKPVGLTYTVCISSALVPLYLTHPFGNLQPGSCFVKQISVSLR